jgi:hypothetical protein
MKEVVTYWRSYGFRIIFYLDDGIGGSSSLVDARTVCARIQADLNRIGFLVVSEYGQWEPMQILIWLGLVWDTYRISHGLWFDMIFYPTSFVFSISEPWEILFITYYIPIDLWTI